MRRLGSARSPIVGHRDRGEQPPAALGGRFVVESLLDERTELRGEVVELIVGQPEGDLSVANSVRSEVDAVGVEVGGVVGQQRAEEGGKVSEVIVGIGVGQFVCTQSDSVFDHLVRPFDRSSDLTLGNNIEHSSVLERFDMAIQGCLRDIAEHILQVAGSHRSLDERLHDPQANRVQEEVPAAFGHRPRHPALARPVRVTVVNVLVSDNIINYDTNRSGSAATRSRGMLNSDVTFTAGSTTLAGTLCVSDLVQPGPMVLLVSGSGPIDRDSNMKKLAIGVMGRLADQLTEAGIASFRYDKRGVGASGGDFFAAGFRDNVSDATAAIDMLRARPDVDPRRVFVVGHSEGALIATELAASDPAPSLELQC